MYCPQCGTQTAPDNKFCKNCGAFLGDASSASSVAAGAAVPPAQAVPPPPAFYPPSPAQVYPPLAYPPFVQVAPPPQKRSALRTVLAVLVVLIGLGYLVHHYAQNGGKVIIGTKDEVIYSGTATQDQATALGNALKNDGYFQDRGVTVLLNKGAGGTTLSFVVEDGYWNKAGVLFQFDEVAREVAASVGGLPLKVQLMDSKEDVEKTSSVGLVQLNGGDAVIYEGEATLAEAQALGQQLQSQEYFTGKGSNVFVGRHNTTTLLSYVVADGSRNQPDAVSGFETLTRTVAPAIGGLPIRMRMVSTTLVVEKDETVTAQGATPAQTQPQQSGQAQGVTQ